MDRWRYACPEGHRNLFFRENGMHARPGGSDVYCGTCDCGYDESDIVDLKQF